MASVLDVAQEFINRANALAENDLTNLKLQKLLYYAQGVFAKMTGKALYKEPILAWQYGPVVKEAYDVFRQCGSFPITEFDVSFDAEPLASDEMSAVQKVWDEIGTKYSAYYLVGETHASGTPWDKAWSAGAASIDFDEIKTFFQEKDSLP